MLLNEKYTQRLEKIEAVLNTWLPESPDIAWVEKVFGPFHSGQSAVSDSLLEQAKSLTRPAWDLINRGGKRWRPLLTVLVAEAIAGKNGIEAALPLTPLVEFPHTASLIHDDIEDNSNERRGKPAVHLIHGIDTSINSGSFMYFLPLACLNTWTKHQTLKDHVRMIWASHIRGLHLGQAMDITWHRDFNSLPSLDDYDRMCRLKTGCLARFAAILGSFSGAFATEGNTEEFSESDSSVKALTDTFGVAAEQLGMGFQVLDDVKNLETGVPGKKQGDDIVEGKKSLPILLYLHRYPEKKDFAVRCFTEARSKGVAAPEVAEFISALNGAGVLEEARGKALEYIKESRRVFSIPQVADFLITPDGRNLLTGLVDLLSDKSA